MYSCVFLLTFFFAGDTKDGTVLILIIYAAREKKSCHDGETFAERIDACISGSIIMANSVVQFCSHANADN